MNKYFIAIPSFKRVEVIKEKTLSLLKNSKVSKDKIYIFVSTKSDFDEYTEKLDHNTYNKIINTNVTGISYNRNYIIDYFNENDQVVFMDDDIDHVKRKTGNKIDDIKDMNAFFVKAFKIIKKYDVFLWATKNMYNAFYKNLMKDEGILGLELFSGDLMGIINRKDMKIKDTLKTGEGEQNELLFRYVERDESIVRFNNIVVLSTKLSPNGKVASRGSIEQRKKDLITNYKILENKYPQFIDKITYTGKDSRGAIKLKKYNNIKIEGGSIEFDKTYFNNYDSDHVFYYNIKKSDEYNNMTKELFDILEVTKIPKIEGPRNDGRRTRGDLLGFDAWTTTFGCGGRRNLGVGDFSPNKKFPELFKKLVEYGNYILPKGYKYQAITVNKDMKAKKHIDGGNSGFSVITGLGDFTGGELNVYDTNANNPKSYDLHGHLLIFNGSKLHHMTKAFKGRRYTLIYYSQKKECKVSNIKNMVGHHLF